MSKTNILIAGIGGVGGYFGGMLAKQYANDPSIEINFFARGEHLRTIQSNGLMVLNGNDDFRAYPHVATDDATEIGKVDYLIISTKAYDLMGVLGQLKACIRPETVILPLLNGVDSKEKIKALFPNNLVLDGCVYIVARLKGYGMVENIGNVSKLFFGSVDSNDERLNKLESILLGAGIDAKLSTEIMSIIWEKFVFISPTASATSYFDRSIGEVISHQDSLETIEALIREVMALAKAKGIELPANVFERTMNRLKTLPFENTSSMHSDYKNHKPQTELNTLTGYVIDEGKKYNIETTVYEKVFNGLKSLPIK
ncbi:MAG TPA: 2-dehydropantoate 2-reductase [Bacteroidia bacterium]